MKHHIIRTLILFMALVCCSGSLLSQSGEIKIAFIGNCGLHLTDGNSDIYIDFPYKSGAHHYMEYDKSALENIKENSTFIFTHKHSDHYSGRRLRKLKGKKYGPWNMDEITTLNDSLKDFSIEAFSTSHRFSFHHCSYLITWHNKKIYFSGDTESAETIAQVKNMDWAFVPAWLLMDVFEKKLKIDSKMFGLYHIGPQDKITSDDPKILLLDRQGQVISIPF
jgi:hypothetical protein